MSEITAIIILLIMVIIPVIAFIDYQLLKRYNKCIKCGYEFTWTTYLLPTVLEILLFTAGIAVGAQLK